MRSTKELLFFDRQEHFIGALTPIESQCDMTINGPSRYDGDFLYDERMEDAVFVAHRIPEMSEGFSFYRITHRAQDGETVAITAMDIFADELSSYGYVRDIRPENRTTKYVADRILEGSRWQVGVCLSTKIESASFYDLSRLEAWAKFIEIWNIEYRTRFIILNGEIVARYVDIYDQIGSDRGKVYQHGSDLLSVVYESNHAEVYTALIGRGKGEEAFDETTGHPTGGYGRRINFKDVEWSIANENPLDKPLGDERLIHPEATALYGFSDGEPRTKIVVFDQIEDPEELLQATCEVLLQTARPKVTYKSTVLHTGEIALGDTVGVVRDDINIKYKTRVFRIVKNLLDDQLTEVYLGDNPITSPFGRLSISLKDLRDETRDNRDFIESVKQSVIQSFFGGQGHNYNLKNENPYGLPGGFYSFDRPIEETPTKVVGISGGSMVISNSKNPDGSWNFTTMGTGDGIVANTLVTGQIIGRNIEIDLNSGNFKLGQRDSNGNFIGNGQISFENEILRIASEAVLLGFNDITRHIRIQNGWLWICNAQGEPQAIYHESGVSFMLPPVDGTSHQWGMMAFNNILDDNGNWLGKGLSFNMDPDCATMAWSYKGAEDPTAPYQPVLLFRRQGTTNPNDPGGLFIGAGRTEILDQLFLKNAVYVHNGIDMKSSPMVFAEGSENKIFMNGNTINGQRGMATVIGSNTILAEAVKPVDGQGIGLYLEVTEPGRQMGVPFTLSDGRLKEDIRPTRTYALETINRIKHRAFKWKDQDARQEIGYITQELKEINDRFVLEITQPGDEETGEKNSIQQVNDGQLLPYITKAIQELSKRLDRLEAKLGDTPVAMERVAKLKISENTEAKAYEENIKILKAQEGVVENKKIEPTDASIDMMFEDIKSMETQESEVDICK